VFSENNYKLPLSEEKKPAGFQLAFNHPLYLHFQPLKSVRAWSDGNTAAI
jgi:hypothetical protein